MCPNVLASDPSDTWLTPWLENTDILAIIVQNLQVLQVTGDRADKEDGMDTGKNQVQHPISIQKIRRKEP